jgi:putative membrane-bound dehydrogenase-like protein
MIRRYSLLSLLSSLLFMAIGCHNKSGSPLPGSAEEALSTFRIEPGFKIELVASEPFIDDPVDMMIDEYGRMYVVEMPGMPLDKSGKGKVKLLADVDGDGRMDKSTVFADSLILPTGVMRWKNGVLVTDPPNVYYMEDTNGDAKADIKKTMLTGFDTSNLEANVNNPLYGIDNWIYLADLPVIKNNEIRYADDSSIKLPESSVRFRPDQHQLEVLSGKTQFGQTFDAWGNHFMVNNTIHISQEVIAARYLARNPDLVVSNATQTLASHSEVFSTTKNPEYQMLTNVGVFTSACGLTAYLGGAFPDKYNSDVTFVCEPVSNLIHVDRLQPDGVTFKANSILEHKDFLTSTDPHCRLVNMYVGPDGALYVIDFYRQVIEGPEFMSEDVLKKVNLYNGTGKGRIYRISASDAGAPVWTKGLKLGDAPDEQLVQKLEDKNIWWRRNAQRLLVDRNSDKAVPSLIRMAQNATSSMGRLHALWTLEGMNKLTTDLILTSLKDPLPGVRENAIKLAELHLEKDPRIISSLLAMQDDDDAKVRFQLLCTLGFVNTPEVNEIRQRLLFKDVNDKWVQIAALSAASSQSVDLLNAVLAKFDPSVPAYASLVKLLSGIIGKSRNTNLIHQFIQKATVSDSIKNEIWQAPILEGLAEGLGNRKSLPPGIAAERRLLIQTSLENHSSSVKKGALHVLQVIGLAKGEQTKSAMTKALQIAGNENLSPANRASAVDFMALSDPAPYASFLKKLVSPANPLPVQLSALKTLGVIPGEEITQYLLQQWSSLSPNSRNEAINTFIGSAPRVKLLLDAIESGTVNLSEISWPQSVRLRSGGEYMMRARTLFDRQDGKRKDVIEQYQAALGLKGDKEKGLTIYQMNCSMCHQVRSNMGRAFGPDLGTVHAWSAIDIMANILDPNKSIAHGYDMWSVTLNNRKILQGIISSETPTAITLGTPEGHITNIARQDISSLTNLGMSAMPNDLETKIDKQQMADLLAFLRQEK